MPIEPEPKFTLEDFALDTPGITRKDLEGILEGNRNVIANFERGDLLGTFTDRDIRLFRARITAIEEMSGIPK